MLLGSMHQGDISRPLYPSQTSTDGCQLTILAMDRSRERLGHVLTFEILQFAM